MAGIQLEVWGYLAPAVGTFPFVSYLFFHHLTEPKLSMEPSEKKRKKSWQGSPVNYVGIGHRTSLCLPRPSGRYLLFFRSLVLRTKNHHTKSLKIIKLSRDKSLKQKNNVVSTKWIFLVNSFFSNKNTWKSMTPRINKLF